MKKFIFSTVSLFVLLTLSACGKSAMLDEVNVESALPQENSVVFMFDYESENQVQALKDLFGQLPETGLGQVFIEGFNSETDSEEQSFENTMGPLLAQPWSLAASVNVNGDLDSVADLENLQPEDAEVLIALKVEDPDSFEKMIEAFAGEELTGEEREGVMYYDSAEGEEIRVARYDDLFIGSNTEGGVEAAVERINNGNGLDKNEDFKAKLRALHDGYFSYFYVDSALFGGLLSDLYAQMGNASLFADSFSVMGDSYAVIYADKEGIGFRSSMDVLGDERDLAGLLPGVDREVSLVEKVNGTGMIMYFEQAGMGTAFGSVIDYYANLFGYGYSGTTYNIDVYDPYEVTPTDSEASFELFDSSVLETNIFGASVIEKPTFEEEEGEGVAVDGSMISRPDDSVIDEGAFQTKSLYAEILDAVATFANISVDDLEEILNSPLAMAFADNGSFLPTFTIYLEIDEDFTAQAKQLAGAFDNWMSQFTTEFEDSLLSGIGVPIEGALKKDVVLVNGGGVHRIYLDWSALPQEALEGVALPGLELEDLALELYYGLTGDNIFVIGFEPDFAQNFGKNVLAKNERYQEALIKVEGSYGYTVSYFDVQALAGLVDRYVELARVAKAISATEIAQYDKVMAFVRKFRYVVSAAKLDGSLVLSDGYIAIGEE